MRASIKAALWMAAVALASSAAPSARADQAAPISEEARAHFKAGVNLLQDPDGERVEDAFREFKAAFAISGSPKVLGNVGYCAMRLERDGEAIDAYTRYLREVSDIDAEERAQIARDVQTMSVGVVRVELKVDQLDAHVSDVRVPVKGGPITNVYGPVRGRIEIGIRPGHHVITVKAAGFDDATWEFDAMAGTRESHSFEMKKKEEHPVVPPAAPIAPPPRPAPVGAWVTVGVGGALLAAGAVTGILALKRTGDISDQCPGSSCPASYDLEGNRNAARGLVRATDFLLLGGAIVAAAGVTWLVLSGQDEQPPPAARALADGLRVRF